MSALFPRLPASLAALLLACLALPAAARCVETDAGPPVQEPDSRIPQSSGADPRLQLQDLVRLAVERSQALGAVRMLTEAAKDDLDETRAGRLPQVAFNGAVNAVTSKIGNISQGSGSQVHGGVIMSATLYDAGRQTYLTAWRTKTLEAARLGQISAEEQLAFQTVALALDRSRYVLQAQVFGQYSRKMACLVDALETITKVDKGRASELVQAQKSFQQSELSIDQVLSQLRLTENRLRRFVGDLLPPPAAMSSVLIKLPDLPAMQNNIDQSPDIAQMTAQASAMDSYARSVAAGQKAQVNWVVNSSSIGGTGKSSSIVAGVNITLPLYNATIDPIVGAARKRADATYLQREDAVETRRYRLVDAYESATSSFDRARQIVDILRNSDKLRSFTQAQWQQLGRRSLFDVMAAEGDYYSLRVSHVNALFDGQQAVASMWSLGQGVNQALQP
nr:TolC family protein [uncultured Roseateles sp.]